MLRFEFETEEGLMQKRFEKRSDEAGGLR